MPFFFFFWGAGGGGGKIAKSFLDVVQDSPRTGLGILGHFTGAGF